MNDELKIRFAQSMGYKKILSVRLKNISLNQQEYDDYGIYTIPYSRIELSRMMEEIYLWWNGDKYFYNVEDICDLESESWTEYKEQYGGV